MPGLSDVHGRLAYLFYRSDDADSAIAEARTALSIDPKNAVAYRFLGLGLYSNGKYTAAVHAFRESLAREPNNADVYYDMGITLRDTGDVDAAAAAYRKAIALNPSFWEAHNNLGMLLHDLRSFDGAIAEYLEAKRLAPQSRSSVTIWAIPIVTKAITMTPSPSCGTCFAWIPVGSEVTTAWHGRSCPSVTTSPPSLN